jgi:hypothetical protein
VLPPLLWIGWIKYRAWRAEHERRAALAEHIEWLICTELQAAPLIIDEVEMPALAGRP